MTIPGQCAEFCGIQHGRMAFRVVAQTPEEFDARGPDAGDRSRSARRRAPAADGTASRHDGGRRAHDGQLAATAPPTRTAYGPGEQLFMTEGLHRLPLAQDADGGRSG